MTDDLAEYERLLDEHAQLVAACRADRDLETARANDLGLRLARAQQRVGTLECGLWSALCLIDELLERVDGDDLEHVEGWVELAEKLEALAPRPEGMARHG